MKSLGITKNHKDAHIMYNFKYPSQIGIEITNRCNFHCKHCINDSTNNSSDFLPVDIVKSVMDYMFERGLVCLDISGGEPLLHPNLAEILHYGYSKNLTMSIASNGYKLTENFIRLLIDCNVSLRVSYDGYDESSYAHVRGEGLFEQVKKNILLALDMGKPVTLVTAIHKGNFEQIPQYLSNAQKMGVVKIRLMPYVRIGRGAMSNLEMISANQWKYILENFPKWEDEYKININIDSPLMAITKGGECPCVVGKLYVVIKPNGDVIPCALLNKVIGNIYKQSLDEIWQCNTLKEINNINLLNKECQTCRYLHACAGGCRGLAYTLKGDFLCKDPFCWLQSQNN